MHVRQIKGFTLIEILLTMGIVAVISALAMPVTIAQMNKSRIEAIAKQMVSNIYLYQQNAFSGKDNKAYGVYFTSTNYILFRGDTFATGDDYQQKDFGTIVRSSSINISGGGSEIRFAKNAFRPTKSGIIRLTDNYTNIDVEVNSEGFISYTKS